MKARDVSCVQSMFAAVQVQTHGAHFGSNSSLFSIPRHLACGQHQWESATGDMVNHASQDVGYQHQHLRPGKYHSDECIYATACFSIDSRTRTRIDCMKYEVNHTQVSDTDLGSWCSKMNIRICFQPKSFGLAQVHLQLEQFLMLDPFDMSWIWIRIWI